jgi:hypothetical protein
MMRKWYHYVLFLLVCSASCAISLRAQTPTSVQAQTGRGIIAGTVRDVGRGVLSSALIEVQPLGRKVA